MQISNTGAFLAACFAVLGAAQWASAGTITGFTPTAGVAFPPAPITMNPGVDGPIAPDSNRIGNQPALNVPANFITTFGALTPIDKVFTVANTPAPGGPVTEYRFHERVVNATTATWFDFHFELGFGTGAGFARSPAGDGLDFDQPGFMPAPNATPGLLGGVTPGQDLLTFAAPPGAPVGPGGMIDFNFSIDVPNLPPGVTSFTLRERPTLRAPEPATWVVFGSALIALALAQRRRPKPSHAWADDSSGGSALSRG